jgi:hypothetical protein
MPLTDGAAREQIAPRDVVALRSAGVLIQDPRREQPRYFDGRFLAARDLIRDQQYFLTREADLGQAAGSGVATGLFVEPGDAAQTLTISPGHGITPAGELVLLPREALVQLAHIPMAEQLSARFGLSRLPQPALRSRTGLFVLALRPVEFTANPIGAYPTSITGQRTVEDGDVIEATAVVLVPWQDDGAADALEARRGRAARAIFLQGMERGVSANVLPLAMLALQSNTVVWIDEAMVRRELGADRAELPGLGFSSRVLRLAHLLQHQGHLADVVRLTGGRSFAAASQFSALPSAGPLPPGVINPLDFTQSYFPAEIDVDFSIVPGDELLALLEEALVLPPIDLAAPPETLDSTAVAILAPVARNEWRAVTARLATRVRAVRPAAPNLVAQRKPLEILLRLRPPRPPVPPLDPTDPSDAEWQRLARLANLWFVRRRNLARRDDLAGTAVRFGGMDERVLLDRVRARLEPLGLRPGFDALIARASPRAMAEVTSLLASPRFADSPALTAAALGELAATSADAEALDHATALSVAARLAAPGVGEGLVRLERGAPGAKLPEDALRRIAEGDNRLELDRRLRTAPREEVLRLAARLLPAEPGVEPQAPPVPEAPPPAPRAPAPEAPAAGKRKRRPRRG